MNTHNMLLLMAGLISIALSGIWIKKSEHIRSDEGELYAFSSGWKGLGLLLGFAMAVRLTYPTSNVWGGLILIGIASLFATQFIIDMKYQELANEWNILLGGLSVMYLLVKQPDNLSSHIVAWLILTTFFFCWWAFSNGLGFGDVKFIFATGFLLTTSQLLTYLSLTLSIAIVYGLGVMLLTKKGLKTEFAFGPFLVIGMLLVGIT